MKPGISVYTFTLLFFYIGPPKIEEWEAKMRGDQNCEEIQKAHVGFQIKVTTV